MGGAHNAAARPVAVALLAALALGVVWLLAGGGEGGPGPDGQGAAKPVPGKEKGEDGVGERDLSAPSDPGRQRPTSDPDAPQQGTGAGGGGAPVGAVDLATDLGSIPAARLTAGGTVQTLPPSTSAQTEALENTYGSIRAYGSEAEGEEATAITFALVQYLSAKASGDWATACARLYSVLRANLEEDGKSCPQAYAELMSRVPAAARAEAARIDVASVRRGEGDRAFVIYKTPATLSADMPLYLDGGAWTVAALEAYALTPEQVGEGG